MAFCSPNAHALTKLFRNHPAILEEMSRSPKQRYNAERAMGMVNDFQAGAGSYDAVLGLNILHLMDNWMEVLNKVHSLLKPGGIFISSTACLQDSMAYLKFILPLARLVGYAPPHVAFFTSKELKQELTDSGFSIEKAWIAKKGRSTFIVAKKR